MRFAAAMADVLAVIECAAKATHIVSLGEAPERVHGVPALLRRQPESIRHAFRALAGSDVDLDKLHLWRHGFTYVADRPDLPADSSG